jgi:hypothetical protein
MFSIKFSAAIAVVLFISAGATQAGGRPFVDSGIGSSQATILAWPLEDRGQANHRLVRSAPHHKIGQPHQICLGPDL